MYRQVKGPSGFVSFLGGPSYVRRWQRRCHVRPQGESPDLWIDPIAYMRIAAALLPTKVKKMGLN
jgi:hypothetical protein